jgi:hypothetical protein
MGSTILLLFRLLDPPTLLYAKRFLGSRDGFIAFGWRQLVINAKFFALTFYEVRTTSRAKGGGTLAIGCRDPI